VVSATDASPRTGRSASTGACVAAPCARPSRTVWPSGNVIVVDRFAFEAPRTKDAIAALTALDAGPNVLLVLADFDEAAVLSVRNLGAVHTLLVDQLNTHDVLVSDTVVIEEAAIALIGTGMRSGDADIEIELADGEEDGQ
jgi:hypothetical protein